MGLSGFVQGSGNLVSNLSQSSYTLTSLTSNQAYDFYVQAVCDTNDVSSWSGPFSFTPAPTPCYAPFGFHLLSLQIPQQKFSGFHFHRFIMELGMGINGGSFWHGEHGKQHHNN